MNTPLAPDDVYFGEISLSGAVRPAGHMGTRLREAHKRAVIPAAGDIEKGNDKPKTARLTHLRELIDVVGAGKATKRAGP